jgi:transcriptional regulator
LAIYATAQSREERRDVLVAAMRDIRLAAIVSPGEDGLHATHAPVVVHEGGGALWLEFHVARPNPHWKLAPSTALAIFQGPSAYVHPGWYPSKAEHGRVVPTWTYVVVHAHGRLTAFDDRDELLAHVSELTRQKEAGREDAWQVTDAPESYIDAMSRGIVGMRLAVDRLEGSWKLNQHKSDADRAGVLAGLAGEADNDARLISTLMEQAEKNRSTAGNR